jgi:prepilin-type N-terminal cleavage/methylation domain-containing protein
MKSVVSKGFTLIEVLISMAIIGVGLIALVTLFPVGLRSSRLAGDFTTASFIGQQALDNIRAAAQVYDPGDRGFGQVNSNGLGYYELPVSAVKGYFSPLRFPTEPAQEQWWLIEITGTGPATFSVTNSIRGAVGTGQVDAIYTSDDNSIAFILYNNEEGDELGVYNSAYDKLYDEFAVGDKIRINLEMRGGVPYYWYAMRAPVTEDTNLDGILGGRLPDGYARTAPYNEVHEDTGLDLVPDFWDTDMGDIPTATSGYQSGLDRPGEFTTAVPFPNDPHGDNRYAYHSTVGWWSDPTDTATYPLVEINPNGTEGNGGIDAWDDDFIQKVTITVGWREGGQDRAATFSASIPNQFR